MCLDAGGLESNVDAGNSGRATATPYVPHLVICLTIHSAIIMSLLLNQCPIRMHQIITGSIHSDKLFITALLLLLLVLAVLP